MVHLASLIILRGCAHNPLPAQGILFQATATSIVSMDPQNQGVVKYFPKAAIYPRAKSYSSCFFWGVCEVRMKNWTKCSGFYPVQSLLSLFIPSLAIAQQEFFPKATTSSPPPTGFVSVYGQRLKVMKWQLTERIFFASDSKHISSTLMSLAVKAWHSLANSWKTRRGFVWKQECPKPASEQRGDTELLLSDDPAQEETCQAWCAGLFLKAQHLFLNLSATFAPAQATPTPSEDKRSEKEMFRITVWHRWFSSMKQQK